MSSRFDRVRRGVFFACLVFSGWLSLSPLAMAHQEGAMPDGQGGTVALASGDSHTCALRADGRAVCWGLNDQGQATPPADRFIALSAGRAHTCGLRADGSALCWGRVMPAEPQTYTALSSADEMACGLSAQGEVSCWAFADAPAGIFNAFSAGSFHACGLRPNGSAECWGNNDYGQAVAPAGTFTAVSAGHSHSCGLHGGGSVACWGADNFGQTSIAGGLFTAVSVGAYHSCAIRLDGGIHCWGDNYGGQTNAPAGTFTALSAGAFHTCGLRNDGRVVCWGDNSQGQTSSPTNEIFGTAKMDAGDLHSCELRPDGQATCWGDNSQGQGYPPLGAGLFTAISVGDQYSCAASPDSSAVCWGHTGYGEHNVPTTPLRLLRAGRHHACAVTAVGESRCWGWDSNGQSQPPAGIFKELSAGFVHSCGVLEDGTGACWGFDGDGQTAVPTLPEGVSYVSIQAGDRHTCALRSDGFINCWGMDYDTQALYPPTGYFRALSVGAFHNCAIRTDGRLWCWGANWYGQTDAPSGSFVSVTSGPNHSCAIASNGQRACWGDDSHGQAPQLSLQPAWLEAMRIAEPFQTRLSAVLKSSGTPVADARFSLVAGTLPPGLGLDVDGTLAGTPTVAGHYPVTIAVEDNRGFGTQWDYTLSVDETPPTIDYYVLGARGTNGWMVSGGRIEWYVYDWESSILSSSGCDMTFFNGDTPGQDYLCSGESAGGQASKTAHIKVDATAPDTTLTTTPGAGSASGHAVFEFGGTDVTSGVSRYECSVDNVVFATCTSPHAVDVSAGSHHFAVRAVDAAGNHDATPALHSWQVDTTPPQVVPTIIGTLGSNGWYVSDVQISWSVSDADSAITTNSGCNTATLASDTAGLGFTCTVTSAGGTTSKTVTIKRDATAPTIIAAPTTVANTAGWYRSAVTVVFSCSDATSGGVTCPPAQVLDSEGVAVGTGTRTISDAAGNLATHPGVQVKIDRTAPTLAPSVGPGTLLLNSTLSASANGNDALSGIASQGCAPLSTASVGSRSVACTATDAAGNAASGNAGYRVVFGFDGFASPVRNPATLNQMKTGRSVPLRWRVLDANGAPVTSLDTASVAVVALACPSTGDINRISVYGGSNSTLQNLGNGYYQLDWQAPVGYRGSCRTLQLSIGDGESHPAQFQFN